MLKNPMLAHKQKPVKAIGIPETTTLMHAIDETTAICLQTATNAFTTADCQPRMNDMMNKITRVNVKHETDIGTVVGDCFFSRGC